MKTKRFFARIVVPMIIGIVAGVGTYIVTKWIDDKAEREEDVTKIMYKNESQNRRIETLEIAQDETAKKNSEQDVYIVEISTKLDNIQDNTNDIKSDIKNLHNILMGYGTTTTDDGRDDLCIVKPE